MHRGRADGPLHNGGIAQESRDVLPGNGGPHAEKEGTVIMPRFIVRYFEPRGKHCITTCDAGSAEEAIAQQKKFCSHGVEFTAEQLGGGGPPKSELNLKDKRWTFYKKDD